MSYEHNVQRLKELRALKLAVQQNTESHACQRKVLYGVATSVLLLTATLAVFGWFSLLPALAALKQPPVLMPWPWPPDQSTTLGAMQMQCFKANQAFKESEIEVCEFGRSETDSGSCNWEPNAFDLVKFGAALESQPLTAEILNGADSVFVLAAHDHKPVRRGKHFDSNFELASRRAEAIATQLRNSSAQPFIPLPLTALPAVCGGKPEQGPVERRTPAVLILQRRSQQ